MPSVPSRLAYLRACATAREQEETRRRRQLRRTQMGLAAVTVLLVIASIASILAWNARNESERRALDNLALAVAGRAEVFQAARDNELAALLARQAYLFDRATSQRPAVATTPSYAPPPRHRRSAGSSARSPIPRTRRSTCSRPVISPDGRYGAALTSSSSLKVWRIADRTPVLRSTDTTRSISAIDFLSDDELIAVSFEPRPEPSPGRSRVAIPHRPAYPSPPAIAPPRTGTGWCSAGPDGYSRPSISTTWTAQTRSSSRTCPMARWPSNPVRSRAGMGSARSAAIAHGSSPSTSPWSVSGTSKTPHADERIPSLILGSMRSFTSLRSATMPASSACRLGRAAPRPDQSLASARDRDRSAATPSPARPATVFAAATAFSATGERLAASSGARLRIWAKGDRAFDGRRPATAIPITDAPIAFFPGEDRLLAVASQELRVWELRPTVASYPVPGLDPSPFGLIRLPAWSDDGR